MHACMHVCLHECMTPMSATNPWGMRIVRVCLYKWMYVCLYKWMHVCHKPLGYAYVCQKSLTLELKETYYLAKEAY
jgi:hypothetical protein